MKKRRIKNSLQAFQRTLKEKKALIYVLRLFVTGTTPNSIRAVQNLKRICEANLKGKYDLEVIDLYQQPEEAKLHNILAAPTLLKLEPRPVKRILGDLSDEIKVMEAVGA
jgi:circadian clock protein KaiB